MGITMGLIITVVSVIGIAGCIIALIATGPRFKKQRQELLEQIEGE